MADQQQTRSNYLARKQQLEIERATWRPDYVDINRFLFPRSGRFAITDTNKGNNRMNAIIDNTSTRALRVLAAGLMAGMTSPARPWFRLTTPDTDLAKHGPVQAWLAQCELIMRRVFNKSNVYRGLHMMYRELGAYGTAATLVKPNFDNVVHLAPLTCFEYSLAQDSDSRIVTISRELQQTVSQLIKEFGFDRCSPNVQNLYLTGKQLDSWVNVYHLMEPNYDRNRTLSDNTNMMWKSCYFEPGASFEYTLRESGFKRLPALAARWDVQGSDVYGTGPGHEALGDIKQLQQEHMNKGQAIDLQTRPPMQAPGTLKNAGVNKLPGGVTYVDNMAEGALIKPLWESRLDVSHLTADIADVRNRINQAFYVDLFLMISQDERSDVTAREIAERHEEKLLMLGPVLERLHDEMLTPLIDITFDAMMDAKIVPTPPDELQGKDISVEFVSMLAQAQRAVGVQSVDRLVATVGSIAQLQVAVGQPGTALDMLNTDDIISNYNDMLGGSPSFLNDDDTVQGIRDGRAKAAAAQASAEQAPAAAQTAKTLSETNTSGKNGITDMLDQFSGYSEPQGAPR